MSKSNPPRSLPNAGSVLRAMCLGVALAAAPSLASADETLSVVYV